MSDPYLIKQALSLWCPDWPRRVTTRQRWVNSADDAVSLLREAEASPDDEPFVSVYSFPRGATTEGQIPRINTLFIDFDVPESDKDGGDSWKRQLSRVLVRTRKVARALLEENPDPWRASLSGNKGVHLFLDFPTISQSNGDIGQFKAGLRSYSEQVEEWMNSIGGVDLGDYLDVTSADLARLCRCPNTRHGEASRRAGEDRYCVPVSIEELATIGPDEYEELTRRPRPLEVAGYSERRPSTDGGRRVIQHIRTANLSSATRTFNSTPKDMSRVSRYREESNESIELDDLGFILTDRPCIMAFREHPRMFDKGDASRVMEISSIIGMAKHGVPIDTMVDFFDNHPKFSEAQSQYQIVDVISRMSDELLFGDEKPLPQEDSGMKQYNCQSIWQDAPEFCLGSECAIFRRAEDAPAVL